MKHQLKVFLVVRRLVANFVTEPWYLCLMLYIIGNIGFLQHSKLLINK